MINLIVGCFIFALLGGMAVYILMKYGVIK